MLNLTGKVAFVTGASYGIGYAIGKGLSNVQIKWRQKSFISLQYA